MAIVNSLSRFLTNPPFAFVQKLTVAIGAGPTTTTQALPTTPGPQVVTNGYVRVKVLNGGSADIFVSGTVQVTDGTGTVIIGVIPSASVPNVASSGIDLVFPFNIDINANSVSVTTTLTGTTKTATLDFEIAGNP